MPERLSNKSFFRGIRALLIANTKFMTTTYQSVRSKLLGAWLPLSDAANVGSRSGNAHRGFLFRSGSEPGGTKECRQIAYGTAALEQLKHEFLRNAQVRELSSEEALQECLRAQIVPFWPALDSESVHSVVEPGRRRLRNVFWR
jgi:hypothetical protein